MRQLVLLICLLMPLPCLALDQPLSDPILEARARHLFSELRCMVCGGQALAGSNAQIAVQMRHLIRQHLQDGKQDQEILDFFSSRYGDDILTNPPKNQTTLPLWIAPLVFLAVGCLLVSITLRRKPQS